MGSFYETDSEIWTVLGKNDVVNFIVLCHELSIFWNYKSVLAQICMLCIDCSNRDSSHKDLGIYNDFDSIVGKCIL